MSLAVCRFLFFYFKKQCFKTTNLGTCLFSPLMTLLLNLPSFELKKCSQNETLPQAMGLMGERRQDSRSRVNTLGEEGWRERIVKA